MGVTPPPPPPPVLVLGFMSLGLLGPSDPIALCVFRGFAELDIVSGVVFWTEGGLNDVFDKFERFWPFGAIAPWVPGTFGSVDLFKLSEFIGIGPIGLGLNGMVPALCFGEAFLLPFLGDHFFPLLSGPCSHYLPRGFISWGWISFISFLPRCFGDL